MTCPFCGKSDDSTFYAPHYERHKIQYIRDISVSLASIQESLVTLTDLLDSRLPSMNWKTDQAVIEPAPEKKQE